MKILVIDIGGTNVKILASGQTEQRRFPSGKTMTPEEMVEGTKKLAGDWKYEVISIGYPGLVKNNQILTEPHNLAAGWMGFDFQKAFNCPVKLINDAAMQANGSYKEGIMLFLGLGTGLGSAMIVEGIVVPMELAHLPYRKGTFEDYLGANGLKRKGIKKWQKHLEIIVKRLMLAIHPDDIVIGGGNAKKLMQIPKGCRIGSNANAFEGGFRLWEKNLL